MYLLSTRGEWGSLKSRESGNSREDSGTPLAVLGKSRKIPELAGGGPLINIFFGGILHKNGAKTLAKKNRKTSKIIKKIPKKLFFWEIL